MDITNKDDVLVLITQSPQRGKTFKVRIFQNGGAWPNSGEMLFHDYDGELYKFLKVENTIFTDHPCGNYVWGRVKLVDMFESNYSNMEQAAPCETTIEFMDSE